MLSKYVPAEKLQIEFLNKWRNTEKYAGDPFAPANYSFEYLFATTMAGQPLAWMEASGLPEEALGIGALIERYKEVQHDFHRGVILVDRIPVGRRRAGLPDLLPRAEPRPEGPDRNMAPRELESAPHAGAGEREGRRAEDRTPRNAGGGTSRAQRLHDVPLRTDPLTNHKS